MKTNNQIKEPRTRESFTETEIVEKADRIMRRTICKENADAEGCLSTTAVAQSLELDVKDLFLLLSAAGVIIRKSGHQQITAKYAHKGLALERYFHYFTVDGRKKSKPYLVWTRTGVEFIKKLIQG